MFKKLLLLLSCIELSMSLFAKEIQISTNKSLSQQFKTENVTYVVSNKIDMHEETVIIPNGCTICFKAFSCIYNGTLVGNDTKISGSLKKNIGCALEGSWMVPEVSDMYFNANYLDDTQILSNLSAILSPKIKNEVVIKRKGYEVAITNSKRSVMILPSHTHVVNKANISLKGNSFVSYSLVSISNAEDVCFKGGKLTGDVGKHQYVENRTSEWGHGINIMQSKDVYISDVTICRCIGDGIYIGGGTGNGSGDFKNASFDVSINNVCCTENRRQGLSAVFVNGLTVTNSLFTNTGVIEACAPTAGIDIEPNKNQSAWNISISNCTFSGNKGKQLLSTYYSVQNDISNIKSINVKDCTVDGEVDLAGAYFELMNTNMQSLALRGAYMPEGGMTFKNCIIDGGGILLTYYSLVNSSKVVPVYNFNGCSIKFNSKTAPETNKGVLTTTLYAKSIGNVTFDNCNISIDKDSKLQNLLGAANNQEIVFRDCRYDVTGNIEKLNAKIMNSK